MSAMTYAGAGVDYSRLDPFKVAAQIAARGTDKNLPPGFSVVPWSRGESCLLIDTPWDLYLAHVQEGLGTKNLVADLTNKQLIMWGLHHVPIRTFYDTIAQDAVAMIVNDMATVGATPLSVATHLAVGDDGWLADEKRSADFVGGWAAACCQTGCVWGPGETPQLSGIIVPDTVEISGSAIGIVSPKQRVIKPRIKKGDAIVLLASSGIHANGLSLARALACTLPQGYLTPLPDGQLYGEALLQPTTIYVPAVAACIAAGVDVHYAVNITGHGWRKLMRAVEPFVYVIDHPGEPQALFRFIQEHGPVSDEEAYGNFNMGAGFALYVPPDQVKTVIELSACHNIKAWRGGHVAKRNDEKKVVIVPKALEYASDSLAVR